MNKFTFGIDISIWQTDYAPAPSYFFDPMIAKDKGVEFAFLRASIASSKDNAFDTYAKTFNAAKIPVGFYHFLYPQSQVSYITQADRYLETIKPYERQLPMVLDVEGTGLGLEVVKSWLGRVSAKTGEAPLIYTAPNPWNQFIGVANATWALEYDYWVANYMKLSYPIYGIPSSVLETSVYPTQLQPWLKHGKPWTFWQFCAAGDGEFYGGDYAKHTNVTALDMNAFNGTLEELYAKYKIGEAPPPPPPVIIETYVRVIAKQLNGQPGFLFFRDKPEWDSDAYLAVGYGETMRLVEGGTINGHWHVARDGFEGYVSAGQKYTEIVYK